MKKTNAARFLDQHKVDYQIAAYQFDLEDLSVKNIAKSNHLPEELIYKTLVAKGDKTGVIVAVIPGHKSLAFKLLAKASQNKKVALIQKSDLEKVTGYIRGGCSPIGMKRPFPVFIDEAAQLEEKIYINAGARGYFLYLNPNDLAGASKATFAPISK